MTSMENIKSEEYKKQRYVSKIRNESLVDYKQSKVAPRYKIKADAVPSNETARPSTYQVIKTQENTFMTNSSKRKADLALITTANEAIISSHSDKSEDPGTQTAIKTKKAIVKSSRAAKKTARAGKTAIKAARKTVEAGRRAIRTAVKTAHAVKIAVKVLSNPVVLKILLITALVAVVLIAAVAAVASVVGIFSSLSFTSKSSDLNDTHNYITELDTDLLIEISKVESASKWSSIDIFHYYTNFGTLNSVNSDGIKIITDTAKLIAYLNSKYDDFSFKSVKEEIKTIHSKLYKINYRDWKEERESYVTIIDPVTGKQTIKKQTRTVRHLDIRLDGISFDEWLELYGNLDDSQKERYENTLIYGGTTMLKCYGSPFIGTEWRQHISSRFGYRIDPVYGGKKYHNGVDISLPAGTEINSVSDGIASVGYDSNGYGNYVTVTYTFNENTKISFLYGHCKSILVTDGQEVKRGDVIATVGSTGKSTGNHLHLTYKINKTAHNPEFYLE